MFINHFKIIMLATGISFSTVVFSQTGTVTVIQDKDIDRLLDFKKDVKTLDIYKIQIYQGERSNAEIEMSNFKESFSEWPISMEYNTPNYKIWVGKFRDRLEADRALMRIKKLYMNAFIFQPKED